MEARLVVVGGKANKSEVRLKLPAMVGRSRDADVTVSHASVSRHHCLIYELEGALVVRDNGSLNGTVVDGQKIQESLLRPGQSLTIGPLTFRAEYDHEGSFPAVGGAPPEANGQAFPDGLPEIDEAAVPSAADEEVPMDGAEQMPAEAEAEPAEDASEGTIQMAPTADDELPDELPDVHFDSGSEMEEEQSAADEFDFLAEEPAEAANTSSKPSFSFLAGDDSTEPADEDDSGAIFRFADDSPQPAAAPKEKSPAAAGDNGAAAKSASAKTTAAKSPAPKEGDEAALNDFLNSLGLEE